MADVKFESVTKRFGDVVAVEDATFTIRDGEFFSLVGPSGCGKTTTLRLIAGLEQPSEGELRIGETLVNGLPPQKRSITMVFQDLALFPNMTVKENIGFNLRLNKVGKDVREQRVREAARMVQIEELLDRQVSEISGGQQQRVALARSSVRDPDVFLLDEPLSDLDAKLKIDIRGELQRLHKQLGTTMVYVTHDQEEAMTMSDRIAVMNEGEVQQIGRPYELYNNPANTFVANFIGTPNINFFDCTVQRRGTKTVAMNGTLEIPITEQHIDDSLPESITLGVRPEDIVLGADNAIATGTIDYIEPVGSSQLVYVQVDGHDLRVRSDPDREFEPGESLPISFKRDNIHYFDSNDERLSTKMPA